MTCDATDEGGRTMQRLALFLAGLVLVPFVLIPRPTTAQPQPKERPQYKNPLDVLVDPTGKAALVVLAGRGLVGVDLVKGAVDKAKWFPPDLELDDGSLIHPAGFPMHPPGPVRLWSADEDKEAKPLEPL